MTTDKVEAVSASATVANICLEIIHSPINVTLIIVCGYLLYKILRKKNDSDDVPAKVPEIPPMKKRDFTLEQLKEFDGTAGADGRVLVAVNGKVFDVTRGGKRFYGPGGPYSMFAGRDASRGLAMFSVDTVKEEYDDLSDLNTMQMESVREWEQQFTEKYEFIGRLLKPGEEPTEYSDEEDTPSQSDSQSDLSKTEPPSATADKTKDD